MRLLPRIQPAGIPSLDGLRALSIACVVIAHADLPLPVSGAVGVTTFFFISGYLITTLLRRECDRTGTVSLRRFYARRTLRIFPPLYLVLAAVLALIALGVLHDRVTAGGVAAASTFTANYYVIFGDRTGLPGQMDLLWSLAVEEHYYLLFPVAFLGLRRWLPGRWRQTSVLGVVCLVVLVWRCWLRWHGASDVRLYYATDTRLDSILWGAMVAIAINPMTGQAPRWLRHPRFATAFAVGAALVVWGVSRTPTTFAYTVGYTVQSLALVVGVVAVVANPTCLAGRLLGTRLAVYVGVVSYALYLVHRPALAVAQQASTHRWLWTAVALVVSLFVCEVLRRTVEDPLRARRARLHAHGDVPGGVDGEVVTEARPGS